MNNDMTTSEDGLETVSAQLGDVGLVVPRAGATSAGNWGQARSTTKWRSTVDRRFFGLAVLPGFVVVFAITALPFIAGFGLSFSSISPVSTAIFPLTLANYRDIFSDPEVQTVLTNTLFYVVVTVVLEVSVGLLVAVLLSQPIRGMAIFRVIFLIPLMVSGVAAGISWDALLNPAQGWIDYFLHSVGLPQPDWLASPTFAMSSVIIADMWSGVCVVTIVVLASLLRVDTEPVEAALVDGASPLQRFRYVIFPAIRPALIFAALLRTVVGFQQFGLFQIITGGGPGLSSTVLNYYIYQVGFVQNNIGYAAALAVVLVLVMTVPLTILFVGTQRR
jgi:multiple sugar transport system permease protein